MSNGTASRLPPLWITLLVSAGLALNGYAWLNIGILPDEAYYWVWSQRLQWGYFDHPPLIAWLIRPFTALFGDGAAIIRLPAVITWLLSCGLAWLLALRIYGKQRAGALAVLVWSSLPIVQAGFHIVTPDIPLVLFAWLSYYFSWQAVTLRSTKRWMVAGVWSGLALLGKYPAILLLGTVFIALLLSRDGRRELASRGPWLAAGIAILLFSPVLFWNYQHDWVSFAFQFGHGVRQQLTEPWHLLTLFLGGQLGVVMPWTFVAMIYASLRASRWGLPSGSFSLHLLVTGFWLPLLLFGAAGLSAKAEANWPLLAYLPGSLLLAGALNHWLYTNNTPRRKLITMVIVAYAVSLLLVNIIRFPWWLEPLGMQLPPQRTQLSQSYGWPQVGQEMERLLATIPQGEHCKVAGASHQETAMLALLLGDAKRVLASPQARISQFTLWQEEARLPATVCLYVEQFDHENHIHTETVLNEWGRWQRVSLLRLTNPDLTTRWFGFFVPRPEPPGQP